MKSRVVNKKPIQDTVKNPQDGEFFKVPYNHCRSPRLGIMLGRCTMTTVRTTLRGVEYPEWVILRYVEEGELDRVFAQHSPNLRFSDPWFVSCKDLFNFHTPFPQASSNKVSI